MDQPKLRPIEAFPVNVGVRDLICLRDPIDLVINPLLVPHEGLFILAHLDGKHSILDIQEAYIRQYGQLLFSDTITGLIAKLDEHLLLDNARFIAHKQLLTGTLRQSSVRPAAHVGTAYAADLTALEAQLAGYFADSAGHQAAITMPNIGSVRGIISPHINLPRGGTCFARAYESIRQVTAVPFIIFGTDHQPTSPPFPLSLKDYEPPFGIIETDKLFVDALALPYPTDLPSDEFAHHSEHSIEFQVLFLQYVLGPARTFRMVPILVGSFHNCLECQVNSAMMLHVADFIQAVQQVVTERTEPIYYVGGGDLAHMSMKLEAQGPLTPTLLEQVASDDHELLAITSCMDAEGYFQPIAEHHDRRRIFGFPPTYMLPSTMLASAGMVFQYDQVVEPATQSMVSYASVVFY